MTIEANMEIIGKRFSCIGDYDVDFDDDGKIQKLLNEFVQDMGCSPNEPIHFNTRDFLCNCYDKKNFTLIAKAILTDAPSNSWCRGPGILEGVAMIENIMEHIARKLKKDPLEVRMKNIPTEYKMHEILPNFAKSVEYEKRKEEINDYNQNNRWIKKGISILPLKFDSFKNGGVSYAIVSIYHGDGTVAIICGGIEMGQGLNTKVIQTAAHILGIPIEKISIKPPSNITAPNNTCTGGSVGSETSCFVSFIFITLFK
jgi:xanthine dehydrogenase/oxidase